MKNFKDEKSGGRGGFGFKKGGGGRDFGPKTGSFGSRGGDFGGKPRFGAERGGKKFGGGDDRGGRPFSKPELFAAVCSTCGKNCEVPFRPSSDKPVYCSGCFGKKSGNEERSFGNDRSDDRGGRDFKKDYKPQREERAPRFEKSEERHDGGTADLKKQLSALEVKVNKIIELLSVSAAPMKTMKAEGVVTLDTPKKERKPKTEKAKKVVAKPAKKVAKKAAKKAKK